MTSKISLSKTRAFHAFFQALRGSLGTAVIGFIVMMLLFPVSTSGVPEISIFNIDYTHNQMKYRLYLENLNYVVNGAVILLGIALAVSLCRFMLVRRSSDAYFALGIKRRKLLLIHSLAGIFYIAVILFIPLFISLILNIVAFGELGYGSAAFGGFFYMLLGFFALCLVSFFLTMVICCSVGTVTESIAFSVIILGGISIILYGINTLSKQLLFGNAFGLSTSTGTAEISSDLLTVLEKYNPVLFFLRGSESYCAQYIRYDGYVQPEAMPILCLAWLVISFLLFLLAGRVLKARKAEIAGVSGKNREINFVVTFLVAFLGFTVILDGMADYGILLAIVSASIVFVVLYFLMEKLQTRRVRIKSWKLPVQLGVVLISVLILKTGGFGYSGRIPSIEELETAQMSYVGSPNYLSTDMGGTGNGKQYYIMSNCEFTREEDLETVISLHKAILEGGKERLAADMENFSSTTVPYDIIIRYKLENGKEITRYYDRTKFEVLEKMLALDETQAVRANMQASLLAGEEAFYGAAGAYQNGLIFLNNSYYTNPKQVLMTAEQRSELLSCIAQDVAIQGIEDRYFPDGAPLGVIMFSRSGSQESLSFAYNIENSLVYVTPSFTKTIQYLKDTNLYQYFEGDEEIENITLQAYNPYVSVVNAQTSPKSQYFIGYIMDSPGEFIQTKDFGNDYVLDTPERIAEVASLLRNDYFMSDGGYLAAIKIKGKEKYVYKFLPGKDAPQYVIFNLREK